METTLGYYTTLHYTVYEQLGTVRFVVPSACRYNVSTRKENQVLPTEGNDALHHSLHKCARQLALKF